MSKKAQGLSLNTIVLLILAVIVLVVIIAGFVMGWGSMWDRVQGFFSKSNVDATVATCNIQCTTSQKNEFCCVDKSVRGLSGDVKTEEKVKCADSRLLSKIECAGKDSLCEGYTC